VLRVGVKLPDAVDDVGDYLADVTALEAAGADTIWLDDTALEPWVMLGAMAAVTHRARLGCLLTLSASGANPRLGPAVAAVQKLSRGRVVVGLPPKGERGTDVTALHTSGTQVFTIGSREGPTDGVIFKVESPDQLAADRDAHGAHIEVWAAIAVPPDRATWAEALAAYEAAGATGVIVSWNDRVLDLLRNSEPDDRTDLLISTG
jgi:hypothetical protein